MNDENFKKIVDEVINSIPVEFKEKIENVAILIADFPTRSQMNITWSKGQAGLLLGLYEGIPKTKRRYYGIGGQLPDKITIFKIPLLRISKDEIDLRRNIKRTIIHEIAHHFGMDEESVRKAERKSRKIQ